MTKETAIASTVHEPFGKPSGPGLWHVKGMQLPAYIQHVAHDLLEAGRAKSVGEAIQMAVGIVKKWAAGIPVGGETKVGSKKHKHPGHIHPDVQAAAKKAIAEWEAKRVRAHTQHAHEHSGGTFVREVSLTKRTPEISPAYITQHFDPWGNVTKTISSPGGIHVSTVDLAMYVDPEEVGEPVGQYDVESAERRLGPDHPHTKRLRARMQRQDAIKGAQRDRYAEHMTQVHKRGDHKSMALEQLQSEHARDHRNHPGMRHGHSHGMSPNGIPVSASESSDVYMSNPVPRYDAWGKRIDLAAPPITENTDSPKLSKMSMLPMPKQHTVKSHLVDHLRNAHGISGSHEQHSVQALKGLHARDHVAKPSMKHSHGPGLNPFGDVKLSNPVDLAKRGDPVMSMSPEAVVHAWKNLHKLPPGFQASMRTRLLARAKQLKINLGEKASASVGLANKVKKGHYVGFEELVKRIMAQGKSEEEARAIAAQIGRAKYGAAKFQKMAASGRRGG